MWKSEVFNVQNAEYQNFHIVLPIIIILFLFFRCRMVQYLIYSLALVSIYTLVLMSLDRFLAVVYALESMTWRTEENCKFAIAVTWIICAFFCIPLIFSHGEVVPAEGLSYCGFMNNQTIPFLPEDWDMRWNSSAFTVSHLIIYTFSITLFLILRMMANIFMKSS